MTLNKQGDQSDDQEPEITVETPAPVPVEPLVETNFVATPVESSTVNDTASFQHTTCTVFAPATLEAGYTFPCRVDGIDFVVTVPEGGVTEGQAFQVPYPTNTSNSSTPTPSTTAGNTLDPLAVTSQNNIPTGKWRNDIWDCFEVAHTGIFWQGWCCTPLLLGQVMTRHKLNPFGIPSESYHSTFYVVAGLWAGFIICFLLIGGVFNSYAFVLLWPAVMTLLITNTRYVMRRRYQIPVKCCHGCGGQCDDFCCGLWCACCVTIQMARHTHPHNEYQYNCCSTTGLPEGTPGIL